MLVNAVNEVKAHDIFGRLEPGRKLHHATLAKTLELIANIPEEGK